MRIFTLLARSLDKSVSLWFCVCPFTCGLATLCARERGPPIGQRRLGAQRVAIPQVDGAS